MVRCNMHSSGYLSSVDYCLNAVAIRLQINCPACETNGEHFAVLRRSSLYTFKYCKTRTLDLNNNTLAPCNLRPIHPWNCQVVLTIGPTEKNRPYLRMKIIRCVWPESSQFDQDCVNCGVEISKYWHDSGHSWLESSEIFHLIYSEILSKRLAISKSTDHSTAPFLILKVYSLILA